VVGPEEDGAEGAFALSLAALLGCEARGEGLWGVLDEWGSVVYMKWDGEGAYSVELLCGGLCGSLWEERVLGGCHLAWLCERYEAKGIVASGSVVISLSWFYGSFPTGGPTPLFVGLLAL
jgi:hypothetical protein